MKNNKLKQFIHLLAGVLLLWHGFAALEKEHQFHAVLFLTVCLALLLAAGLQHLITRHYPRVDGYLFLFEGLVLLYSALQYKLAGASLFFTINLLAGFLLLSAGLRTTRAKQIQRRYKMHRRQHVHR